MKICIIGDFSKNLDEGLKNLAHYIADYLAANFQIMRVNIKKLRLVTLKKIKKFHPHIIHYIPGPTNKSILLLKLIKAYLRYDPKIVLSAPHPRFNDIVFKLLNFKPDYVFATSKNLKERMDRLGIPSLLLPNGVDIGKFLPVDFSRKMKLREKYGIPKDEFTILHVGHLIKGRNLGIFTKLSKENQIVIVAGEYIGIDRELFNALSNTGCIIFRGYFPNIEEFYQLADCYLFPVRPGNSILCPLTIMEAMSCNLPVITTDFEGIKTFFKEGDGLIFARKEGEIFNAVNRIKNKEIFVNTRKKVTKYSWQNIIKEIVKIYKKIYSEG